MVATAAEAVVVKTGSGGAGGNLWAVLVENIGNVGTRDGDDFGAGIGRVNVQ